MSQSLVTRLKPLLPAASTQPCRPLHVGVWGLCSADGCCAGLPMIAPSKAAGRQMSLLTAPPAAHRTQRRQLRPMEVRHQPERPDIYYLST